MVIKSEQELIDYGAKIGGELKPPAVIELIGDVGAGKTTFTRGLAKGLGVKSAVTSPSFTISKRYAFKDGELVHYDFYRLEDPGLMSEDLAESLSDDSTITVIEWSTSVKDLLPKNHLTFEIALNDDGTREIKTTSDFKETESVITETTSIKKELS